MNENTTQNVPATTTDTILGTAAAALSNGRTVGKAKAKPEVKPASSVFEMLTDNLPAASPTPRAAWDGAENWARSKGFPCTFKSYRDAVLSRIGALHGKCKWSSGGTSLSAKLALDAAFAEVCKHVKATAKDKEAAEAATKARRQLKVVLAVLSAIAPEAEVEIG